MGTIFEHAAEWNRAGTLYFALLLFPTLCRPTLQAQIIADDSITKRFELPSNSAPLPEKLQITDLYFASPTHGYITVEVSGKQSFYRTRNGGANWEMLDTALRPAIVMIDSLFGLSPATGERTDDAAETWKKIRITNEEDTEIPLIVVRGTNRNVLGGLIASPRVQPVWSTDGGATWIIPDVDTVSIPEGALDLDSIAEIRWQQMFYAGDSVIYLKPQIRGYLPNGQFRIRDPLCVINPRTGSFEWRPNTPGGVIPQFVDDTVGFAITDRQQQDTMQLWRSVDGGKSWTNNSVPVWVEDPRFFSADYGISRTARTHDGGLTWQRWWSAQTESQYTPFFAADSAILYVAGPPSFFARSTDAGRTWQHNHPATGTGSGVIHDSVIVLARDLGSLIVSNDAGESFRDIGAEGGFPPTLGKILALTVPDTADPRRLLGIGQLFDYDSGSYLQIMESPDGGLTWNPGDTIENVDAVGRFTFSTLPGTTERIGMIIHADTILISNDLGITWRPLPTLPFIPNQMLALTEEVLFGISGTERHVGPAQVWRSTDGGAEWEVVYEQLPTMNLPVELHSPGPGKVTIIFSDWAQLGTRWRVVRSADGGEEWEGSLREGKLPGGRSLGSIRWIDSISFYSFIPNSSGGFDPFTDTLLVFRSPDEGMNFDPLPYMIIHAPTGSTQLFPAKGIFLTERYWYLIDQREGLIRIDLQKWFSSVEEEGEEAVQFRAHLSPNIVRTGMGTAILQVMNMRGLTGELSIELYSSLGKKVDIRMEDPVSAGNARKLVRLNDLDMLEPGYYTVVVRIDEERTSVPLIVL